MNIQKEFYKLINQLIDENPKLDILTMTNYEVCGSDDCLYWRGQIEKVDIDYYYSNESHDTRNYYFGKDEIMDVLENELGTTIPPHIEDYYNKKIELNDVKEAIIIWINL